MIRQIVKKRDGRTVPFDKKKIADAIFKAAKVLGATTTRWPRTWPIRLSLYLEQQYGEVELTVEQVQRRRRTHPDRKWPQPHRQGSTSCTAPSLPGAGDEHPS